MSESKCPQGDSNPRSRDENPRCWAHRKAGVTQGCFRCEAIARVIASDPVSASSKPCEASVAQLGHSARWGSNPGKGGKYQRVRDYRVWRMCTLFSSSNSLTTPICITGRFGGAAPREAVEYRKPGDLTFHFRDKLIALLVIPGDRLTVDIDGNLASYQFGYVHVTWGVALIRVIDALAPTPTQAEDGAERGRR